MWRHEVSHPNSDLGSAAPVQIVRCERICTKWSKAFVEALALSLLLHRA